jgi:anti-sigma factor ChrR (cupin superfamily)
MVTDGHVTPDRAATRWQDSPEWQEAMAPGTVGPTARGYYEDAAKVAVAADRRALRAQIEALRRMTIGHVVADAAWKEALDAVLALLGGEQ